MRMRAGRTPGWAAVAVLAVLAGAGPARAEDSVSQRLAQQLTTLLDQKKLDSVATRDPGSADSFVAALYFPGAQLLVIGAKYAAPALLNEKILRGNYRDVYIDLNAATDPATKVVIEDLYADGLRSRRKGEQPPDAITKGTAQQFAFDGQWRKRKVSEDEYLRTFSDAETQYTRMLELLIAELKRAQPQ
jgi:hypothetical protein